MAKKTMFHEDYLFKGTQCDKVAALIKKIDENSNSQIFSSAIELFIFASLVGSIKNRKAEPEKDNTKIFRIMANQFFNHIDDLKLALKFVLITSEIDNPDPVSRLNKTFRNPETDDNYTLFEKYMLGGLDELYENLILDNNREYEDYLTCVNELMEKINKNDIADDVVEVETDDFIF